MDPVTQEDTDLDAPIETGSDRTFGFLMAAVLALVSLLNGWHLGNFWPWTATMAAMVAVLALVRPSTLHLLNRIWMKFGLILHRIVNPVVMALLFFGTILPTGLVMRIRGKDLLRIKHDPDAESYWIERVPGPAPETMKDQF